MGAGRADRDVVQQRRAANMRPRRSSRVGDRVASVSPRPERISEISDAISFAAIAGASTASACARRAILDAATQLQRRRGEDRVLLLEADG